MTKRSTKKKAKPKAAGGKRAGSGRQVPAPIVGDNGLLTLTSLMAVGREFGVSHSAVKNWTVQGMPGKPGEYKLKEVIQWYLWHQFIKKPEVKQHFKDKEPAGEGGRPHGSKGGESSDELKRQIDIRKIRAEDLKYAQQISEVIPRDHVKHFLTRMMAQLNTAGELLRRHHGDEAQRIQLDALDAFEKEMQTMFGIAEEKAK